jgi:hypothetical protein
MISVELYDQIRVRLKHKVGIQSLERVRDACDTIDRTGGEITAATVGRECVARWKGPTAASIRNARPLVRYIKLRRAEQLPKRGRVDPDRADPPVEDPAAVAQIRLLRERARVAEERLRIVLRLVSRISPVDLETLRRALDEDGASGAAKALEGATAPECLPDVVRTIAQDLLDEERLGRCGLELHNGQILRKNIRQPLLGSKQVDFLKSVLSTTAVR